MELLSLIEQLPYPQATVPIGFFVLSWGIARLFRLPLALVVIAGSLPFLSLYVQHPFAAEVAEVHPLALIVGGWCLLLGLAVGYRTARWIVKSSSTGGLSLVWLGGTAVSIAAALALYLKPELLDAFGARPRNTFLLTVLAFAFLSFVISIGRVVKSGAWLAVWACICLTLASELFLGGVPREALHESLRNVPRFLPAISGGLAGNGFEHQDRINVAVLSATLRGQVEPGGAEFSRRLEQLLNAHQPTPRFEVVDFGGEDFGVYQYQTVVSERLGAEKPDAVILGGWESDARLGENFLGIPGLDEAQALTQLRWRSYAAKIPLLPEIAESRMFGAARRLFGFGGELPEFEAKPRVAPEQYQQVMAAIAQQVKQSGALPVFVHEPSGDGSLRVAEQEYRRALQAVSSEERVPFIDLSAPFQELKNEELFAGRSQLSSRGLELAAKNVYRGLLAGGPQEQEGEFFAALESIREFPDTEVELVAGRDQIGRDLLFSLDAPDDGRAYYRVVFSVNDQAVDDKRMVGAGPTRVRFKIPKQFNAEPAVRVRLSTQPSPQQEEDQIGESGSYVPAPLRLVSTAGSAEISSGAETQRLSGTQQLLLGLIDARSGALRSAATVNLDSPGQQLLTRFARSVPRGDLFAVTSRGPIGADLGEEARAALRYAGIMRDPKVGSYFAAVGVAGSKLPGAVQEGVEKVTLQLGSERAYRSARFRFSGVASEASGKPPLRTQSGESDGDLEKLTAAEGEPQPPREGISLPE